MSVARTMITVLITALIAGAPSAAFADTTPVTLSSTESTIHTVNGKDTVQFTVSTTLPAGAELTATLTAPLIPGCQPTPTAQAVTPGVTAPLEFSIAGCSIAEGARAPMKLTVGNRPYDVFVLRATPLPNWAALWAFPTALGIGAVVILAAWGSFWLKRPADLRHAGLGLSQTLPNLSSAPSFAESWVSNFTVVTSVFTGVFGTSDLLQLITGVAQPATAALVTVAAAIGIAVLGAAPIALQILRTSGGTVYVIGLLVSATVALGAAGGLILVVAGAAQELLPAPAGTIAAGLGWTGGVVLAAYAFTAIRQNLDTGLRNPSDEHEAFRQESIFAVVDALGSRNLLATTPTAARQDLTAQPPNLPPTVIVPRRSALI